MALPTNTTTSDSISQRTRGFAKAKLLDVGQHILVTERFGQVDPMQRNRGTIAIYRRYETFARAVAPMAEGIPPVGQKLSYTDITCTLEQLGDNYKLTDVIQDTHEDKVLDQMMKRAGQAAAESVEEYRINALKAGTNVFYAAGATSRATVNSTPTVGDFRRIFRYFKRMKAREKTELIAASSNISTEPIAPSYFVMGHTDLLADLKDLRGFVEVKNYSDPKKAITGEVGALEGFRIVLTAMFDPWVAAATSNTGTTFLSGGAAPSTAVAPDVYYLLFAAEDSYGIVPLQGKESISLAVVNPGTPTKDDPHGQIGFVSWDTWQACVILNQSWFARLECCATANPD
jgi:N4-gp56 family major capsid protein